MPLPTWSTGLGIAKEAVFGTPVPATSFIPVTGLKPVDTLTYYPDKGWRAAPVEVYDQIAGPSKTEVDFDGNVHADTIGFPIAGILGNVVTTGASAPFTHVISAEQALQPPSYTLTDDSSVETRLYPGCVFSELGLKFAGDNLLTYTAKAVGLPSATGTKPTESYSTVRAVAGWAGVVQIAGSAVTTLMTGEVTLKRVVTPLPLVGAQKAYANWGGYITVDGKLDFVMEDAVQFLNYLNNSQPSLDITYTIGTASVKVHCTKAAYTAAVKDRGKDYLMLQVTFSGLGNTTDAPATGGQSPTKVTLVNALPAGTYR
jgi:hypothetical protein